MFIVSGEQAIEKHQKRMSDIRNEQWRNTINDMSPANLDLTQFSQAAYSKVFKLDNKQFQLDIHTESSLVDRVTRGDTSIDALYQLRHESGSIIVGVPLHPMCDRRWNDEVVPLSDWAKVMTSMMLNTEEGRGRFFVVKDVIYSIAIIDPMVANSGIFRVLD